MLNPYVLGPVVSKLGLRNRSGDTPRPRHATNYRAECLGFAKPARMATDVHACGLELSSEKIENVVLLGGKTIQNFSSMNASGFWTLSGHLPDAERRMHQSGHRFLTVGRNAFLVALRDAAAQSGFTIPDQATGTGAFR